MAELGVIEFMTRAASRQAGARRLMPHALARPAAKPKVASLFALDLPGPDCLRLVMPLTCEEWVRMGPDERQPLLFAAERLLDLFGVERLGLPLWYQPLESLPLSRPVFSGNVFLAALALTLARASIAASPPRRIYVAGHTPYVFEIIDMLCFWQRPVIWSCLVPRQGEIDLARMLYERGTPASVTGYNPANWGKNDLVLMFTAVPGIKALESPARIIDLTPAATGLLSRFEAVLREQNVDACLGFLCPLMEAFLSEEMVLTGGPRDNILQILRAGIELDIWEVFLDNRDSGLYNTIKGLG